MVQKTILVVEDSPLLRRLIMEEAIARFAGQTVDFTTRSMDRKLTFGDLTLIWSDTLEHAEHMLKTEKFDGAIIDIGFPTSFEDNRLEGNRNGLKLVKGLREGAYPLNMGLPVAVTSVEHVHSKIRDFFPDHSEDHRITKGFFKGKRAPGTEGSNVFNSTISSYGNMVYDTQCVAAEPVEWLAEQLRQKDEPDRASDYRRRNPIQPSDKEEKKKAPPGTGGGWWFRG